MRAPSQEIVALSALYRFLEDGGHVLENPCHKPRSRRKNALVKPYHRAREPVVPNGAQLRALFDAVPSDLFRALFLLCFYTAARPQSEACQLRHGDLELPEPHVQTLDGSPAMGTVTYRDTKTGGDRTLPLHPEAGEALQRILVPQADPELPVFRKRGRKKPMDRASYRKAWLGTLRKIEQDDADRGQKLSEGLGGMVLRDLRPTARTVMTEARIPEVVIRQVLGHQGDVSEKYYRATESMLREAIFSLGNSVSAPNRAAAGAAGPKDHAGHAVARRQRER